MQKRNTQSFFFKTGVVRAVFIILLIAGVVFLAYQFRVGKIALSPLPTATTTPIEGIGGVGGDTDVNQILKCGKSQEFPVFGYGSGVDGWTGQDPKLVVQGCVKGGYSPELAIDKANNAAKADCISSLPTGNGFSCGQMYCGTPGSGKFVTCPKTFEPPASCNIITGTSELTITYSIDSADPLHCIISVSGAVAKGSGKRGCGYCAPQ